MATKHGTGSGGERSRTDSEDGAPRSPRELVVVARPEMALRATPSGLASAVGADVKPLESLLAKAGATLEPLFGVPEDHLDEQQLEAGVPSLTDEPRMSQYYSVLAPEASFDELADRLQAETGVESAYVKPPAELAAVAEKVRERKVAPEVLNDMRPRAEAAPAVTPDLTPRQIYLNPAPAGIDARHAWSFPGGRGAGVRVIDLEWGWRFTHEDLIQNQGGVVAGTASAQDNHGTAVLGEISGDRNSFGITGIAPDAHISAVAFSMPTARAILLAANRLRAGDIMLLEIHRAGPRFDFQPRADQRGYIAIEWWPDDFAAIRNATQRGIIVVEAAGNGAEDFDDGLYDTRPAGFPATWSNPFNPANPTSLAVVVGAGAPPPGTHGRNHGPDRSRLDFSNHGRRVDCQGWGREVTTTGYGDLQGGIRDEWYTDTFSGTSSASPIVVGALACVQGVRRARQEAVLTPAEAINVLRRTGSLQTDAPGRPRTQRIGNRPNLRQLIAGGGVRTVTLYRYWNPGIGDHFYTTNWSELGSGRYGYRFEGIQCHVFPRRVPGSAPLYRYWNPGIGDHFYTTNWSELGQGRYGYRFEGVQGHVFPRRVPATVPLYRYWNPGIGDHFYTTNWSELGQGRYGYRFEGVQCYVFARPSSRPSAGPGRPEEAGMAGDLGPGAGAPEFEAPPEELGPPFAGPPDVDLDWAAGLSGDVGFEPGPPDPESTFPGEDFGAGPADSFLVTSESGGSFPGPGAESFRPEGGEGASDSGDSFTVARTGEDGGVTVNLIFGKRG